MKVGNLTVGNLRVGIAPQRLIVGILSLNVRCWFVKKMIKNVKKLRMTVIHIFFLQLFPQSQNYGLLLHAHMPISIPSYIT
jgi:hypothetical protein